MEKEILKARVFEVLDKNGGYARMKQFKIASLQTSYIKQLLDEGILEKIKAGLYRDADLKYPAHVSLGFVDVSKAIPTGVICLISALSHYDLTTFNPSKIYVAIPHGSHWSQVIYPPVDVFHFRNLIYNNGIEVIQTEYGEVKIYNREKTICDMFRLRNKLGDELALEALKNYLKSKYADLYKLKSFAETCRVKSVLLPYLKAMVV